MPAFLPYLLAGGASLASSFMKQRQESQQRKRAYEDEVRAARDEADARTRRNTMLRAIAKAQGFEDQIPEEMWRSLTSPRAPRHVPKPLGGGGFLEILSNVLGTGASVLDRDRQFNQNKLPGSYPDPGTTQLPIDKRLSRNLTRAW